MRRTYTTGSGNLKQRNKKSLKERWELEGYKRIKKKCEAYILCIIAFTGTLYECLGLDLHYDQKFVVVELPQRLGKRLPKSNMPRTMQSLWMVLTQEFRYFTVFSVIVRWG